MTQPASSAKDTLPSTLLRLCVLCASSLEAMCTSPTETVDKAAAAQDGRALSERISSDTLALVQKVRKEVTALSLAMRPSSSFEPQDHSEPLDGVDDKSIEAASHLLQSLATEAVPKLVFLANMALTRVRVYSIADSAEHDPLVEQARESGAHIVLGEGAKGPLADKACLGALFVKDLRLLITDIVAGIGELCQSFMDTRTRTVLARAQQKREGTGKPSNPLPPPSRAASLALTKKLWTLCDAAEGDKTHTPAYVARLPRNNYEALCKSIRRNELLMRDSQSELQDALDDAQSHALGAASDSATEKASDSAPKQEPASSDETEELDDVEDMWERNVLASEEGRVTARAVLDLVTSGIKLVQSLTKSLPKDASEHRLDDIANCMDALAAAQDELTCAALFEDDSSETNVNASTIAYVDACKQLCERVDGRTIPDIESLASKLKSSQPSTWSS